mgnify:CR=1 FL=1
MTDIAIATITEDLFEEYRFYLKKRGLATATMNRYLCWLSRLMYRAVSQRLIRCNPFENVKYEKAEQKIRFLQKSDITKLMALRVIDKEAEQARRMFIFSCFTGLAIADMEHLQFGHVQTAADGQKYIRKERQKTKVEFIVPLHPIAEAIINQCKEEQPMNKERQTVKDKDNSFIFRTNCSRSVMNAKIDIVGKACGIRERLSYHMARHTFGTMSLGAGIPIESIAKMMGHTSISSTQIYAQVTDNKISEDMDRLIRKHQDRKRNKGGNRMNVNHHQTKRDRSYFEWGDNMQIIRKGKGEIAMTESELVDFFGVIWRKLNHCLQLLIKVSSLYPEERNTGEVEVFINGQLKGYAPLYPLTIIIALSYQLDSTEAHLFRKYICRELQRPAPVMEQIFLYGSGSIN